MNRLALVVALLGLGFAVPAIPRVRSAAGALQVARASAAEAGSAHAVRAGDATSAARQETRDTAAASRSVRTPAELDRLTGMVSSQIRCVVCRGLSIKDSPSGLARRMKSVVREQLAAGRTPDEVKAYFVAKYGEWVLLTPKPRGFNLLVYVLPGIALVTGFGVIVFAVRRWTRPAVHE